MTRRALVTGLATAALVAAGALSAAVPAAADAPAPPYTAIAFRAPELSGMPWGGAFSASAPADAVTVGTWGGDGVRGSSGERSIAVFPPSGATLTAGTSFPLQPNRTAGAGTVELVEPGHACTYQWGTVTVQEVTRVEGALTTFSADVAGSCATASVRLAATTAWSGLSVVDRVEFPNTDIAALSVRDVEVTVEGGTAVLFGDAHVTALGLADGDQAEDFGVMDDGCSGTTVQPGSSCTVTVGFSPWEPSMREARLVIPDGTAVGSTEVRLAGFGTTDSSGTYVGIDDPKRLLDTRTSGTKAPLAGGSTTRLQVAGAAGVPASGVSAVVLNLTAVTTTSQGYFTMYPNGVARPTASSINFPKGWTGANMVTVPVGADGKVALYNYGGAAHAVVDVLGWYWQDADQALGSQLLPIGDAIRLYDSRTDGDALAGGDFVDLTGIFGGPEESAQVSELVVTVTAVGATRPGVLTAWSGVGTRPKASTVNYEPKVIAPNMAIVSAGQTDDGAGFRISNTGGTVDVVVDLVGIHFTDSPFGLRFTPRTAPTRILDTRKGTGLSGAFGPAQTRTLNGSSVANEDTFALVANTTGVLPTKQTYLSVWAAEPDAVRPDASILNVNPGLVRSVSTYAPVSYTGRTRLYNNAGSMHVVMDVAGTLDYYPRSSDLETDATADRSAGTDAGAAPTVAWPGGRDLRPTVTVEHTTATVTRG